MIPESEVKYIVCDTCGKRNDPGFLLCCRCGGHELRPSRGSRHGDPKRIRQFGEVLTTGGLIGWFTAMAVRGAEVSFWEMAAFALVLFGLAASTRRSL